MNCKVSNFKWLVLLLVGIVVTGCNMIPSQEPLYKLTDLQALWLEKNTEHYVRFTTEQSDEAKYLYGREWDEADEVYESDLLEAREALGHPGNGWFKYYFETKDGGLTEIHLMDNGGAEIPKIYVVSKLTDTDLVYYDKEYPTFKYYFSKVVETK